MSPLHLVQILGTPHWDCSDRPEVRCLTRHTEQAQAIARAVRRPWDTLLSARIDHAKKKREGKGGGEPLGLDNSISMCAPTSRKACAEWCFKVFSVCAHCVHNARIDCALSVFIEGAAHLHNVRSLNIGFLPPRRGYNGREEVRSSDRDGVSAKRLDR